ncbi:MAG TPA: DUF2993 domain-containing protein [Acidimicrobiales bacterium]|nr:DUF2993 domain-containing protein [Acidimicrobiales bacterium]
MRRLIIAVVVLGGAFLAVDVGARTWAQGQIETRARAEIPKEVSVGAHIRAFPFLPPLLIAGRVSEVGGHFENVPAGALTLSAVDIVLHGVRINRNKLLHDRKVELVSIDEGTVTIEITAAVLSKAAGVPITISNGQMKVAGVGIARVSVQDNALVIAGVRTLAIPKTRLVPCATNATLLADRVRLSCTIRTLPPALLGAANRELGN